MPKISEIFTLGKSQRELDFVNIDPDRDFPVYLNPFVLSHRPDPFSVDASRTINSFFQHSIELIRVGQVEQARANFRHLNEPNETCLGVSKGRPRGRGMGRDNANDLFESVLNSRALETGLIEHLEDTAIFIPGIGRDKVSDMTTNIIRAELIEYTQAQCNLLGIPITPNIPSGFFWNTENRRWEEEYTEMLIIDGRKILLVPKGVVSYVQEFTHKKYHQDYALEFLQEDHLRRNTSLVQTRYNDDGSIRRRFVTKVDLEKEELPGKKNNLLDFTQQHPEIFQNFRTGAAQGINALPNEAFEDINLNDLIDYLIDSLQSIPPGPERAGEYHSLMVGILEFIFYPNLINPVKELEINQGRKRIDISFDNGARLAGFFHRLQHGMKIPCRYIFIECKNYTKDVHNPELDQMVGRLSPNRGMFGIIACRSIDDEALFMQRCTDSFKDEHGLIIPLTDADIIRILNEKKAGNNHYEDEILSEKARQIITG